MTDYQEHRFQTADGLTLYAREHGAGRNGALVCLHGLTRNAADFDALAAALSDSWRIIALDFRGRGRSDRDPDWHNYVPASYVDDVLTLLQTFELEKAFFCGTSLGGLVTMLLAAKKRECVQGVILNDIGPVIDPAGLARIQAYTGTLPPVSNWDEAAHQTREIYGDGLPEFTEADWLRFAHQSYRENAAGHPELDFDPAIGQAIRETDMGLGDPWQLFAALSAVPTLVLRGENSDILGRDTVAAMHARKPDLISAEISNRGHVPLLNEPDSVRAIRTFLASL